MEFNKHLNGRAMAMVMAIATLVVFGLGGAAIITWWQGRALPEVFTVHASVQWQLIAGILGGTIIGLMAMFIVSRKGMSAMTTRYGILIQSLNTTPTDRLMISICAGVGEEIFFRGALQHWLGVPITAVVFVAIHGYLDPRDRKLFLYGLFMTVVMLGFGYVAQSFGLWAPIAAHMMIDIVLLEYISTHRPTAITAPAPEEKQENDELYKDEQ